MRQIVLGVVVIASIVIVACSSDSENDKGGQDTKSGTASSGGTSSGDTTPAPTSSQKNPPPPASKCSPSQGADACIACCGGKHPGGMQVWETAYATCICAAANCATECAQSACAETPEEPTDGDECSTCIANASTCEQEADTTCEGNTACAGFADCVVTSKCEPAVDGGQ